MCLSSGTGLVVFCLVLFELLCLLSRGLLLRCRRFGRLFSFSLGRLGRLHFGLFLIGGGRGRFGLFLFSGRGHSGFHIGACGCLCGLDVGTGSFGLHVVAGDGEEVFGDDLDFHFVGQALDVIALNFGLLALEEHVLQALRHLGEGANFFAHGADAVEDEEVLAAHFDGGAVFAVGELGDGLERALHLGGGDALGLAGFAGDGNVGGDERYGFAPVVALGGSDQFLCGFLRLQLGDVGFDAGGHGEVALEHVVELGDFVIADDNAAGHVVQHLLDGELAGDLGLGLLKRAALLAQDLHELLTGDVLVLEGFELLVHVFDGNRNLQAAHFVDDGAVADHLVEHGFVDKGHLLFRQVADAVALDEAAQMLLEGADAQFFAVDFGDDEIAAAVIAGARTAGAVHEADGSGEDDDEDGEDPFDLGA